jgi:hypothetical protein
MKKYKIRFDEIHEYEVIKETKTQLVFINEVGEEKREYKLTSWYSWHDTYEDAKQFLIAEQTNEINKYNKQIEFCKEKIEKYKLL